MTASIPHPNLKASSLPLRPSLSSAIPGPLTCQLEWSPLQEDPGLSCSRRQDGQLNITAWANESVWLLREQSCGWLEQKDRRLVVSGDFYPKWDYGWPGRKSALQPLHTFPGSWWIFFLSFFQISFSFWKLHTKKWVSCGIFIDTLLCFPHLSPSSTALPDPWCDDLLWFHVTLVLLPSSPPPPGFFMISFLPFPLSPLNFMPYTQNSLCIYTYIHN